MIIWITFIGSAACFRRSAHMGIDLIFSFVKGKAKKAVQLFTLLMSLMFVLLLLYYGIRLLLFAYNSGQITPALQIKTYLVYIGIPLGAFLSSLEIVSLIYKEVKTEAN
jgi:C4-dicarboxylate transporter DctQ subunit